MKKFSTKQFTNKFKTVACKIVTSLIILVSFTPLFSYATKEVYLYDNNKEINLVGIYGPIPGQTTKCGSIFFTLDSNSNSTANVSSTCYSLMNVATDYDIAQVNTTISSLNTELTSKITAVENSTNTKFKLMESNVAIEVINKVNTMLMFEPVNGKDTLTTEKFRDFIRKIIKEELAKASE